MNEPTVYLIYAEKLDEESNSFVSSPEKYGSTKIRE
jgi:hypothetical protein